MLYVCFPSHVRECLLDQDECGAVEAKLNRLPKPLTTVRLRVQRAQALRSCNMFDRGFAFLLLPYSLLL